MQRQSHNRRTFTARPQRYTAGTFHRAVSWLTTGLVLAVACSDDEPGPGAATDAGGTPKGADANGAASGGTVANPSDGGSATGGSGGSAGSTGGAGGDASADGGADAASGGAAGTIDGGLSATDAAVESGVEFDGMDVFRHDTFGDEQFWTDTLMMHEVIASAVDPMTALSVGLKVDADALPAGILETVDLEAPATTVALLELGAVVGLKGRVEDGKLTSVGVACALCHSTVDDSVMPGIGKRLDGHANRDLDPGLILSLSPSLQDAETQAALTSWGPGRYDPYWNQDGINGPVLIPPIYGLQGVPLETYTGEGPISYWNAYVGVTQMGGQGTFVSEALGIDIEHSPDRLTPKLPALLDYQLSLQPPSPADDSFDAAAAALGEALFNGKAQCGDCHSGPELTDAASRLHDPAETGMDPQHAGRGTTGQYRTTPLRALFDHAPYFHDGSAASLSDVVEHYDTVLDLSLTNPEQTQLVEYLKSL